MVKIPNRTVARYFTIRDATFCSASLANSALDQLFSCGGPCLDRTWEWFWMSCILFQPAMNDTIMGHAHSWASRKFRYHSNRISVLILGVRDAQCRQDAYHCSPHALGSDISAWANTSMPSISAIKSTQTIETYRPRPNTGDETLSTNPSAVKCLSGLNLVGSGNLVSSRLIPLRALSHFYPRYMR